MVELLVPLVLSLVQLFSDRISVERSRYREHIASFASAIAVTYLIFVLLPEIYTLSNSVFLLLPLFFGFVGINVLEKLIYSRFGSRFSLKKLKSYHDELHASILFIYHFSIGVTIMHLLRLSFYDGLLLLPPLLLFSTIGNWSLHHSYVAKDLPTRAILSSATMFGALSTNLFGYTQEFLVGLLSFASGILMFVIVSEALPTRGRGKPLFFLFGAATYLGLILLLSSFGIFPRL